MPEGPVQTPLQKVEWTLKLALRAVMMGAWDEATFKTEVDLAIKNEVPLFLPGEVPSYMFITQAAQEFLDAREKVLKCYDAWVAAGKPPVTTPYWETRS